MTDEVEYSGYWWLPTKPDLRLPGTLLFSRSSGVRLELHGNLDTREIRDPRGVVILGESSFGEQITVYQSLRVGGKRPLGDVTGGTSSFMAGKAFVGCHFQTMQEASFVSVHFRPPYLDDWLGQSSLDIKHQDSGFAVSYTRPTPLSIPIDDDLKIGIGFASTGPDLDPSRNHLSFNQNAFFVIKKSQESHFSSFGELIARLCNFLALAVVAPVHPLEIEGFLERQPPGEQEPRLHKVKILLPLYVNPNPESLHHFEMLFTYGDVIDKLESFLRNWFRKKELLGPVHDLFFGVLHNTHPNPVLIFLNYIQAIETYHIRKWPNKVDPPDVHKQRIRTILDSVPAEHKDWLSDKLAFSNSPTLADRLRDIISLNPRPVVAMTGDRDTFIKQVKDSRNYYTHYNPALREKAETGGRLKGLSMVLGTMLEAILLCEMGFDLAEVQTMQEKRRRLPDVWF